METVSAVARLVAPLLSWASSQPEAQAKATVRHATGEFGSQVAPRTLPADSSHDPGAIQVYSLREARVGPGLSRVDRDIGTGSGKPIIQPGRTIRRSDLLRLFPAPFAAKPISGPSRTVRSFLRAEDLASIASTCTSAAAGNWLPFLDNYAQSSTSVVGAAIHGTNELGMSTDGALSALVGGDTVFEQTARNDWVQPAQEERPQVGSPSLQEEEYVLKVHDEGAIHSDRLQREQIGASKKPVPASLQRNPKPLSPDDARRHAVAVCLARGQLRLALTALRLRSEAPLGLFPGREPDLGCYPRLLQAARFDKEGPQTALDVLDAVERTGAIATPLLFLGVIDALVSAPRFAVRHVPAVLARMALLGLGAPRDLAMGLLQFEMAARLVSASARSRRGRARAHMRRKRKKHASSRGSVRGDGDDDDDEDGDDGSCMSGWTGSEATEHLARYGQRHGNGSERGRGHGRATHDENSVDGDDDAGRSGGRRGRAFTASTVGDTIMEVLHESRQESRWRKGKQSGANSNVDEQTSSHSGSRGPQRTTDPYAGIDDAAMAWLVPSHAARSTPDHSVESMRSKNDAIVVAPSTCTAPSHVVPPPVSLPGFTASRLVQPGEHKDEEQTQPHVQTRTQTHTQTRNQTQTQAQTQIRDKFGGHSEVIALAAQVAPKSNTGDPHDVHAPHHVEAHCHARSEAGGSRGSGRRSRRTRSKAVSVRRAALEWYGGRGLDLPAVGVSLPGVRRPIQHEVSFQSTGLGSDQDVPDDSESVGAPSLPRSIATAGSASGGRGPPVLPQPRRSIDFVTWARALTGCPLRRVGSLVANHQQALDADAERVGNTSGGRIGIAGQQHTDTRVNGSHAPSTASNGEVPIPAKKHGSHIAGMQQGGGVAQPMRPPSPGLESKHAVRAIPLPGFNAVSVQSLSIVRTTPTVIPQPGLDLHASPPRRSRAGTGDSKLSGADTIGSGRSKRRKRRRRRRGPSEGEAGLLGAASMDGVRPNNPGDLKSSSAKSTHHGVTGGRQTTHVFTSPHERKMARDADDRVRSVDPTAIGLACPPHMIRSIPGVALKHGHTGRVTGFIQSTLPHHDSVRQAHARPPFIPMTCSQLESQASVRGRTGFGTSSAIPGGGGMHADSPPYIPHANAEGLNTSRGHMVRAANHQVASSASAAARTGAGEATSASDHPCGSDRAKKQESRPIGSAVLGGPWAVVPERSTSGRRESPDEPRGGSAKIEEDMKSRFGLDLSFL